MAVLQAESRKRHVTMTVIKGKGVYLRLHDTVILRDTYPAASTKVAGLTAANPAGGIYPPRPGRGGRVAQLLLKVVAVSFKNLRQVPVFTGTKDRKGLARTVPPPKEVLSQAANEARPVVSMAHSASVLPPAVLVGFAYKIVSGRRKQARKTLL